MSQSISAQSNIIVAWGNLIDPNQTITQSSQNALAPMSNACNDFRGVVGQTTGCTSEYLQVTFAAGASPFNCFGVAGCNITTSGTVALHGSTDGFGSVDDTLIGPIPLLTNRTTQALNFASLFTGDAYSKYTSVRLVFVDPTNPAGYIQLARAFVGTFWQPTYNWSWGMAPAFIDLSEQMMTQNKVIHFNAKVHQAIPEIPFHKMPEADKESLDGLYETCGIATPFFLQIDPDFHPNWTYWARLKQIPKPVLSSFRAYDLTLEPEEWI